MLKRDVSFMIFLIGGPPRCGKTTVARRLAAARQCSWMQTDYLETAFATYFAPGQYAPMRLDAGVDVARESHNDLVYAKYSAAEIIDYYRALAKRTWTGLQAVVEYALFDGEDLVLEGFHIDPASVRQFLAETDANLAGEVRPVFLIREDFDDILATIKRGGHKNDWVLTKTRQDVTFERIARMIVQYSQRVRHEVEQAGFPVFEMDGDFMRQAEKVIAYLAA
jgi:2-phosphoglycerate kinase